MIDSLKVNNKTTLGLGSHLCDKHEIIKMLDISNDQVIAIDCFGEYVQMAKEVGGKVIDFGLSNPDHAHINVFDVSVDYSQSQNIIKNKIDFLVEFFDLIMGAEMSPLQISIIEECTKSVYNEYLSSMTESGKYNSDLLPTLKDLYEKLIKENDTYAGELARAIEIFVCDKYDWFEKKTDIEFSNKFVVIDLQNVRPDCRDLLTTAVKELVNVRWQI